jgi:hypothetical protein
MNTVGGVGTIVYGAQIQNVPTAGTLRNVGAYVAGQTGNSNPITGYLAGLEGRAISLNTNAGTTVPLAYGLKFAVQNDSNGLITSAHGINVGVTNGAAGTGTITNGYGVYVNVDKTTGSLTNAAAGTFE